MSRILWVEILALSLPMAAGADYLYGLGSDSGAHPYVLFVADVSGSMAELDAGGELPSNCCECTILCGLVCGSRPRCSDYPRVSRMQALKDTLRDLIPQMDNVSLGISKFGVRQSNNYCRVQLANPLPTSADANPPTQTELLATVNGLQPDGGTPIGQALEDALSHLLAVRGHDQYESCRPYAVVVLTDGEPDCPSTFGGSEPKGNPTKAYESVEKLRRARIPTYVVGFGKDAAKNILDEMARKAGTARISGGWCNPGADGTCSSGQALYAETAAELLEVLQTTFQQIGRGQYTVMPPMIATVPQEATEYDRVSNNFMAYTSFEIPNYKGRLYGVRLFQENEDNAGVWDFTDLSEGNEKFDLTACGKEGNPCVFDAGALLQARTSSRNIYFATPAATDSEDGALVLTMGDGISFGATNSERNKVLTEVMGALVAESSPLRPGVLALEDYQQNVLGEMAKASSEEGANWRRTVADWVEGSGRPWKLGDMYHAAPAIVTQPPYSYRGYGYPTYKANYRLRPSMIYVGANDGQIHAFYASDDHFPPEKADGSKGTPRWQAGEEAWAYVPFNLLAKVSLAAVQGEARVFSQDLSCRVDDVIAHPTATGAGTVDCTLDPEHDERGTCGWRTVLVCGQGWGGSWYVALDVTDPLEPRPMWEATHLGNMDYGLGRTWVVPSVGAVNMEVEKDGEKVGVPTWLSIFGSGYNTSARDYQGDRNPAYRYLNMPFSGPYPEHGWGIQGPKGNDKKEESFVYIQDLVSGKFLKTMKISSQYGITADIPLVGTSDPFFVDVGYFGGWAGGKLGRLHLPMVNHRTKPDLWGYCEEVLKFSESKPLTSRPSVYTDPRDPTRVYAFVGSGLDPGNDPDQQQNQGKMWEFQAFSFLDEGGSTCPKVNNANVCTSGETLKNIFNDGSRLISPPTLAIQRDSSKWLTFTTWKPGGKSGSCGDGTSFLYCLDVTGGEKCAPCGNLDSQDEDAIKIELGGHKSQTPVVADDQIYVIGDDGEPLRIANQDGTGKGPGGNNPGIANQGAPKAMVLSWREIF